MSEKAERFRALHQSGCFIIPNAWDAGSTRLLTLHGAQAIATTSAGLAFMLGRKDGQAAVTREEAIQNARDIAEATTLPVSADLEDGYGPTPDHVADTIKVAIAAGLCGCTIEDTTADPNAPLHTFEAAIARIRAAVAAARTSPHPFILTARAENYLHGNPDLDDTIRRLTAFAEAGADCLYAPALPDMPAIEAVVRAVAPKPVNVLIGPRTGAVPQRTLAEAGVRRISLGGAIARAAYGQAIAIAHRLAAGDLPAATANIPPHANLDGAMQPKHS